MRTGANISCSLVRPVKNRGFRLRKGPFCTSFPPRSAARSGPHSRSERNEDNRGLRPRGTLYFLAAKSTKNSPADAFAYFVPANVRNGRLFAGLQANRPRFLPLLAGTSFDGSASGRNRSRRNAARSWRNSQIGYSESCHRPWKRVSTAAFSLGAEREQPPARESDMRMVLVLLTSLRSFSSFWHGIARKRSLLVLRASVATKR